MIENYIYKLNVNPFWGSLLMKSFYKGYSKTNCPMLIHYIILPLVLSLDTRNLFTTSRLNISDIVEKNPIPFSLLQQNVWQMHPITNLTLIHLHNTKSITFQKEIQILETVDYNDYEPSIKEYLECSFILGELFKDIESVEVFKLLKVIP